MPSGGACLCPQLSAKCPGTGSPKLIVTGSPCNYATNNVTL